MKTHRTGTQLKWFIILFLGFSTSGCQKLEPDSPSDSDEISESNTLDEFDGEEPLEFSPTQKSRGIGYVPNLPVSFGYGPFSFHSKASNETTVGPGTYALGNTCDQAFALAFTAVHLRSGCRVDPSSKGNLNPNFPYVEQIYRSNATYCGNLYQKKAKDPFAKCINGIRNLLTFTRFAPKSGITVTIAPANTLCPSQPGF